MARRLGTCWDCHFGPLKLSLSSITPISTTALRISNKIERRLSALFSDDRRFGYDGIKRFFSILLDTAGMFAEWERIVIQQQVAGKNAHDARLVASMKVHSITNILTFNSVDFSRYPDITIIEPQKLSPLQK